MTSSVTSEAPSSGDDVSSDDDDDDAIDDGTPGSYNDTGGQPVTSVGVSSCDSDAMITWWDRHCRSRNVSSMVSARCSTLPVSAEAAGLEVVENSRRTLETNRDDGSCRTSTNCETDCKGRPETADRSMLLYAVPPTPVIDKNLPMTAVRWQQQSQLRGRHFGLSATLPVSTTTSSAWWTWNGTESNGDTWRNCQEQSLASGTADTHGSRDRCRQDGHPLKTVSKSELATRWHLVITRMT
jgi:hypothetical protein